MWKSIQKFGLQQCDLPTMLQNVSFFLRVLIVNIEKHNKKPIPTIFYLVTVVTISCYFYVYLVSMVWFVCQQKGDLVAVVVVFSLGIASEIAIWKLVYMFIHIKTIRNIVAEYLACDLEVTPESRFHKNLKKSLRNVKKRAMIFWIVIMGNGVVYILKPIISPGRHFMEDLYITYGLEPMFASPNYEIAFILMTVGIFVCCYLTANTTIFFIVTTGYTESQILALSEELLMLWKDAEIFQKTRNQIEIDECNIQNSINKFIKNGLRDIIKRHIVNLNLIGKIDKVYRGALAIEFLILITALVAELLAGLENTYIQMPFAMMQVGMDCLTGQRLLDASLAFQTAVYDCKWENFSHGNMKTVMLMLQTSQKPLSLSAGGVAILSFNSFMSIVKSIYSAYTTLRTTMY